MLSATVQEMIRLIGLHATYQVVCEFLQDERAYFPVRPKLRSKFYSRLVRAAGEANALTLCQYFKGCLIRINGKRLVRNVLSQGHKHYCDDLAPLYAIVKQPMAEAEPVLQPFGKPIQLKLALEPEGLTGE